MMPLLTLRAEGIYYSDIMLKAVQLTSQITSLFQPQTSDQCIEAEVRWTTFVAKHNIPFLSSDYATKRFKKMFPDSEIAKIFSYAHAKTTAIIKRALVPHFTQQVIDSI